MSSEDGIRALGVEYRRLLVKEVRSHKVYSRVAALTGVGIIGLGFAVNYYISDIGYLLVLFGMLRIVTALYDHTREDDLQHALKRLDDRAAGRQVTG